VRGPGCRATVAALAAAALAAGCGGGSHYRNRDRPPRPITVTASVDDHAVRVSPTRFGAGPVVVIVSNQSSRQQRVTFATDAVGGARGGIRASTPVGPQNTAHIQVTPRRGSYRLSTADHSIRPASLRVGGPRRSAQNQLLSP
jgi:hypothetical protein